MKNKKGSLRKLTPMPAAAAVLAMAASAAHGQTTPVFDYTFPASWDGSTSTVVDQSSAGNNGTYHYGLTLAAAPPGDPGNSISLSSSPTSANHLGGFYTDARELLNNTTIAADGGFTYNIDFLWNGAYSSSFSGVEKLIDSSGTESLQIVATNGTAAKLEMTFNTGGATSGTTEIPVTDTIAPNTWYDVTMTFNTTGNSVVGGSIAGVADLYVDGILVSSGSATKGSYGASNNRPIGIGQFGYPSSDLIGFNGDIYEASVDFGVAPVPEPTSLALSLLGGLGVLGVRWNASRRKRWDATQRKP